MELQDTKFQNLLSYLTEVVRLKYKTYYRYSEDDIILWFNEIPKNDSCFSIIESGKYDSEVWLEIKKSNEPALPATPKQCQQWIKSETLKNIDDLPQLYQQITTENDDETVELVEHPEVEEAWEKYLNEKWLDWSEKYRQWKETDRLYKKLYQIHQQQEKASEEYELILGMGQLRWNLPDKRNTPVHRHLITAKARLNFTAKSGRLSVSADENGTELKLEYDMLDHYTPAEVAKIAEMTNEAEDDPWENRIISNALRAFVNSLADGTGEYSDNLSPNPKTSDKPKVHYAPAIILRKRRQLSIHKAIEDIEKSGNIPPNFGLFVSDGGDQKIDDYRPKQEGVIPDQSEPILPLPYNDEQKIIVEKHNQYNSVLVQGPPGTGKSLTIANLICHLLANGKKILVTAQTAKALRVLKDKIPAELQGLCVNLLGESREDREEFQASITTINRKYADYQSSSILYAGFIIDLEESLHSLKKEKASMQNRLAEIKEKESRSFTAGSHVYSGTLVQIIEKINVHKTRYCWLKDKVSDNQREKIIGDKLQDDLFFITENYESARKYCELEKYRIPTESLREPEYFINLAKQYNQAVEGLRQPPEPSPMPSRNCSADKVSKLKVSIRKCIDELESISVAWKLDEYKWMQDDLRTSVYGTKELLLELRKQTDDLLTRIHLENYLPDEYIKSNTDQPEYKILEDLKKILDVLESGEKIKTFLGIGINKKLKDCKYIFNSIRVKESKCDNENRIRELIEHLELKKYIKELVELWRSRADISGYNYKEQIQKIKHNSELLDKVVGCADEIKKSIEEFKPFKEYLSEPQWTIAKNLAKYVQYCEKEELRIKFQSQINIFNSYKDNLENLVIAGKCHPLFCQIVSIVKDCDCVEYRRLYEEVVILRKQKDILEKINGYMTNFEKLLPETFRYYTETYTSEDWKGRSNDLKNACDWAVARRWIKEFEAADVNLLSDEIKRIEKRIKYKTLKLAETKAWHKAMERIDEQQSKSLRSFALIKIPKTGKARPRKLRQSQQLLKECKDSIPVLITPLYKVYETISFGSEVFDVLIIDEASQCGIESLPVLSLASKIIIVGDNKQVSPEPVGIPDGAKAGLPKKYLKDFSLAIKGVLEVDSNLYDIANVAFQNSSFVRLVEHFRCMPEIIRFNNKMFYSDNPLIPLRRYTGQRLNPLESVLVDGGYAEGPSTNRYNPSEVEAIVNQIEKLCGDPEYKGKTMGVIALQGHKQYKEIEKQLLIRLGATELEERKLRCGNASIFQGDERDVIFLSMVVANNERFNALGATDNDRYQKSFNVAVSRAKDQLWLFHSVEEGDLSPRCLRLALLKHFRDPVPPDIGINLEELRQKAHTEKRTEDNRPEPFDSWFEIDVFMELANRSYSLIPQYKTAGRRIDIVVNGSNAQQLAVECDGECHDASTYLADLFRQRQLERVGWEFFIIKEWEFRKDSDKIIQELTNLLNEKGITPTTDWQRHSEKDPYNSGNSQINRTSNVESVSESNSTTYKTEDVLKFTPRDYYEHIVSALETRPNQTAVFDKLPDYVLKQLGLRTRGEPREKIIGTIKMAVQYLENEGKVEFYKAKNKRVRLLKAGKYLFKKD